MWSFFPFCLFACWFCITNRKMIILSKSLARVNIRQLFEIWVIEDDKLKSFSRIQSNCYRMRIWKMFSHQKINWSFQYNSDSFVNNKKKFDMEIIAFAFYFLFIFLFFKIKSFFFVQSDERFPMTANPFVWISYFIISLPDDVHFHIVRFSCFYLTKDAIWIVF